MEERKMKELRILMLKVYYIREKRQDLQININSTRSVRCENFMGGRDECRKVHAYTDM